MSSTKPTTPRARPVASAPPTSPRTEENQGYRRGRAIRSCLECRRRKMRCNRSRPCQNCNRFCRECVYLPFPEWPSGAASHTKEQGALQGPVRGGGRTFPPFDSTQDPVYVPLPPYNNQDYGYDSDALVKHDRFNDADADDDFSDVALQIGRLSITEKTGDFFRPHIASQIATLLSQANPIVGHYNPQTPYGLPSSQFTTHPAAPATHLLVKRILPLEPSPGFLTTASQPFLPQPGLELPSRNELHFLYRQYWSVVDPLAHIVHKPSFEEECRKFLLHGQVLDAAPASFKALLLAMCLAAAVSLPLVQAKEILGVAQQTLVSRLKIGAEKALRDADFMSSVKIQTLQAFTIYLIPQCQAEISKSHALYVGTLVRRAMSAGLNRDPSGPGIDPADCQVRRLLWHQICFLDVISAEAQGTQLAVQEEQFDTSLPLNLKDDALGRSNNESVPAPIWTEATFAIIRYECSMVHRLIFAQRLALELGQIDLETVRNMVSVQRTRIERLYLQYLDDAVPVQRWARLVGRLYTARFDAILLHRYSPFNANNELQADIREALIYSSLTVCECAVALDTDPGLAPWAWYARAYHQYEPSIFLLMEVHRNPMSPYAERINAVLNHVFGSFPGMGSRERSRHVLQVLGEEFNKMTQMRKFKLPQLMVSDNGSSSPNDHTGMATTPEEGPQWGQWQPEPTYGHGYRRDLPPVSDAVWWPSPASSGMLCDTTIPPQHDEYATPPHHEEYGYGLGLGPV